MPRGPHRKRHVQLFFCCCALLYVQCSLAMTGYTHRHRPTVPLRGLRCHRIHTKPHKAWFQHSKAAGVTETQHGDLNSPLLLLVYFYFEKLTHGYTICTLYKSHPLIVQCLTQYLWNPVSISRHLNPSPRRVSYSFGNPILFAICNSTFSKLCTNLNDGMQKSAQ
jgi:hypothetical protein